MVAGRGGGGAGARRAVQPCRMPHAARRMPHAACRDEGGACLRSIPSIGGRLLLVLPPQLARQSASPSHRTDTVPLHRACTHGHGPWMRGACAYLLRRNARVYVRGSRSVSRNQKVQHVGYWLLPCGALWAPLRALQTSVPRPPAPLALRRDTPTLTHSTPRTGSGSPYAVSLVGHLGHPSNTILKWPNEKHR